VPPSAVSPPASRLSSPAVPARSRIMVGSPAWPAGLVALTVLLVCVPSGNKDVSASVHVTPGDLGSVALVVAAGIRVFAGKRLPRNRLWVAVGAAVVGFAVATVVSHDPVGSVSGFVRYLQLFVIVPVAVVLSLRDRRDLRLVCAAVLAAALFEGALGTWQYLAGTGAAYGSQSVRAVGTFGALDILGLATVVGYGIIMALGLAIVLRGRVRLLLLAIAALLIVPLLLSLSRGAVLASTIAVAVMLIAASPRLAVRSAVFGGAAAIVLAGVFGAGTNGVGDRLATIGSSTTTPDRSVQGRYDLWHAAVGIWQDHPLTGVGLKQFAAYRDSYAPLSLSSASDVVDPTVGFQREPLLTPHNMYLLVLSEQGVVGLIAFGSLLLGVAVMTVRRTWQARDGTGPPDGRLPDGRLISAAAVGIIARTLVVFLFGDIGGQSTVMMSVLFGAALWWAVQPPPAAYERSAA